MILWLIKMFHERKEERALEHRKFASMQYSKTFRAPSKQYSESNWKSILIAKSDISLPIDSELACSIPSLNLMQKVSEGKISIDDDVTFCFAGIYTPSLHRSP